MEVHDRVEHGIPSEKTMISIRTLSTLAFAFALGCGGSSENTSSTSGSETMATPATFAEQVTWGGRLYGEHCANCHGDSGQGTADAPSVVGLTTGALPLEPRPGSDRTSQFVTVSDIGRFVVANMPPRAPGSLHPEEYWAILAFDLSANGITLEQPLTAELATTLAVPR